MTSHIDISQHLQNYYHDGKLNKHIYVKIGIICSYFYNVYTNMFRYLLQLYFITYMLWVQH